MSNYKDSRPLNVDFDYDSLDILCPTRIDNNLTVTGTITDNSAVKNTGLSQIPNNTVSIPIYSTTTLPSKAYNIELTLVAYQPSSGLAYATKQLSKVTNNAGVLALTTYSNIFSNGIPGAVINYVLAGSLVSITVGVTPNATSLSNLSWEIKLYTTG